MPETVAGFVRALQIAGALHPLIVGVATAIGVLWGLHVWADDAAPPLSRRIAGVAVVLLGLALLLRLGLALNAPRPLIPWWQALIGAFVLPIFLRHARIGGVVAMLWFLCLAILFAAGAAVVTDVPLAIGASAALGLVALFAMRAARRWAPVPPPTPVPPAALQQRLDTDDAREGADKYTRE